MATTTFDAIREQMATVLEGLTPGSLAGTKFRETRDEADFFGWCAANPTACHRRFEIRGSSYEGPGITNTDLEYHTTQATVTVAYPKQMGKYGPRNMASLEAMVELDKHQIDNSIGLRGGSNWLAGQGATVKVNDETAEQGGVLFLRLTFDVGYFRSV